MCIRRREIQSKIKQISTYIKVLGISSDKEDSNEKASMKKIMNKSLE